MRDERQIQIQIEHAGMMRNKLPAEVGLRKLIELDFSRALRVPQVVVVVYSTTNFNAFRSSHTAHSGIDT